MALPLSLDCSKNQTLSGTDGSEEPDWSDLPPELISLISRKLTDISDFVRFRVVCKRWRSAVQASDLAPQLPWIMRDPGSFKRGYMRFYSLLTGKTYTINVPQNIGKSVRGSAYNYVISYNWHTHECSLFNPLTNEELSLPQPQALISDPWFGSSGLYPGQSSRYVILSESTASYFPLPCGQSFLSQPGDHEWTSIELGKFWDEGFTFHDGRCYASDRETGYTKVIDLATHTVTHVVPHPEPEPELRGVFVYLVASFGVILRVCQYQKMLFSKPYYFRIYRLELGDRDGNVMDPCWVEIDNINNHVLFLHGIHGCAFKAEDFPGLVGNNIYYSIDDIVEDTFEFFRYDIEEQTTKELRAPENLVQHWFVPSLC